MDEKEFYRYLGEKLRKAREERGISQTDIAGEIGVKSAFISAIEKGGKASAFRIEQILNVLSKKIDFAEKKTLLT
jgi:transcriptional regulator with XRE-family HTH domain